MSLQTIHARQFGLSNETIADADVIGDVALVRARRKPEGDPIGTTRLRVGETEVSAAAFRITAFGHLYALAPHARYRTRRSGTDHLHWHRIVPRKGRCFDYAAGSGDPAELNLEEGL